MNGANTHDEIVSCASVITDEQAKFFLNNGFLILRNIIRGEELRRLRAAMDDLTASGSETVREHPDFAYGSGHRTGRSVLRRIEYVIDKADECKALLGHPFILRSVEKLMGPDYIPTWDSMVLKLPREGIEVPWHRDAGTECVGDTPIFNVDYYLDAADEDTCVWVIPGSHRWSRAEVDAIVQQRDFHQETAVPALMRPGDVMFHNILVLHGSPRNGSDKLRRVIYYEFRAAHVEAALGPHIPEYIPLKQRVLLDCIERRKTTEYIARTEEPYEYQPPAPWNTVVREAASKPKTHRYPHGAYWRR
ncbi:MAG: phytanoyl-CoA dioxygenase family protein [Candidatus Hydrogenedentes bacterium]|nr:phytanoyl-CoA dioxygenase family protein [Candidatus Hydrogenedentota bacterium]